MKSSVKSLVKYILSFSGFELKRKRLKSQKKAQVIEVDSNTMSAALGRLRSLGIEPNVIIDVGAASGDWSKKALEFWPASKYKLIEPLYEQRTRLVQLQNNHPNISVFEGVAGEKEGEVLFSVTEDLDGSGVYGEKGENLRNVPVITLDDITGDENGSFLIKLDTHGYELQIFDGAENSLKKSEVLIIEVYGFHVSPTALLFHQLSSYLEKSGFRLFDIIDVMRRAKDSALWQADAVYLRSDNPIFNSNSFK